MFRQLSWAAVLVVGCGGNSPKPESPEDKGIVETTKESAGEAKEELDDAVEEAGDAVEDATDK